jgi:hypothetical protein
MDLSHSGFFLYKNEILRFFENLNKNMECMQKHGKQTTLNGAEQWGQINYYFHDFLTSNYTNFSIFIFHLFFINIHLKAAAVIPPL